LSIGLACANASHWDPPREAPKGKAVAVGFPLIGERVLRIAGCWSSVKRVFLATCDVEAGVADSKIAVFSLTGGVQGQIGPDPVGLAVFGLARSRGTLAV
jgi:hypothetical protein